MRPVIGCVLVLYAVGAASNAEQIDEVFAGWNTAQGRVESLIIEFRLRTTDSDFGTNAMDTGEFRLVRTRDGAVFASYKLAEDNPQGGIPEPFSGLLTDGKVYLLGHEKKCALRFTPAAGELPQFLEKHFNPFVVLLDRQRAETKCQLGVAKVDESHIDLTVKAKFESRDSWSGSNLREGRIAVMRQDSDAVPKGMPRWLWYADGGREYLFDITAWRLNPADGPKLEEFVRPEDRPGWSVQSFFPFE